MNEHGTCKEWLGSLSDYVDGDMDGDLCADLEKHLQECPNCQVVVNTMRKTIELYHDAADEIVPDDVRERLFACLQLDDYIKKDSA